MKGLSHSVFYKACTFLLMFSISVLFCQPLLASLGGDENSIETDRQLLGGKHSVTIRSDLSVHEITNNAVRIKELTSPAGVVFGITWRGVAHPDLSILLGPYFSQYDQASRKHKKGKGERRIKLTATEVVVIKSGHMRDVRGKAYVPKLMPEGITPEDIQW